MSSRTDYGVYQSDDPPAVGWGMKALRENNRSLMARPKYLRVRAWEQESTADLQWLIEYKRDEIEQIEYSLECRRGE